MAAQHLFDLEGKTALVTGAGRGLGRGYARALAQAGCFCICAGRRQADLADTVAAISAQGGKAEAAVLDVTDRAGCRTLADRYPQIDILVNNAGFEAPEPFLDVTEAHYDAIMAVNLKGVFFLSQVVAGKMKEQGHGKIINIASLGSYLGLAASSVYCASKGAIVQLTKTMAIELASDNIQVNAIAPGYFLTQMTQPFFDDPAHKSWIETRIPAGRIGDPEDLSGALVFLSSHASDYVTGQTIAVDGGWLAG
ncbi:SDR family NAD(P)-dependent oxidoreductase [Sporolactobacillus spathodeae]|uniref:NAD(P)-dependent dehydrogenase (Short-subunit alcohol dehydrogenase family) n=1 Tax=Sporolactobacillus spathodeae TaxID=1465502 RepID=A0ABS2QAZ1_9BACL|nr:glucose 1-dehydrogenase [Sporolactobacillus spathodeae]MBM7658137.1 NAD(P)-dependent dehydrogenase (short-subunit alcohol dehydrogenase family) [Sporolactobacillus spathodeae]